MYKLFFLLLLGLASCNNRVVRFKISGQTQNMKYATNAYLYIEKDSLLQNCYIYTGNESKKKFDLYKCPLISNSFHFKGKVLRSNTNPVAVAYLFLDTLNDFSTQKLMRRIRSDHKMIILNDKRIAINIKNNLIVTKAISTKGDNNIAFDDINTVDLQCFTNERCQNFIQTIKKHYDSATSLYFLENHNNFRFMPLEYLEEGMQYTSPKLKKTSTYKRLAEDIKERRKRYNELNLK